MKCGCGNTIHPERFALGYKLCTKCGERIAMKNKKVGYISYGHKTAGSIVITNKTMLEQYQAVSYRHAKGSNMASASRQSTSIVNFI